MQDHAEQKETRHVLPNFLIVGAGKCGTTSLFYYLKQHPDVYMSPVKEPRFLSSFSAVPGRGPGDLVISQHTVDTLEDYARLFEKSGGRKAVGEASVDNLFRYKEAIPAIKRYLGDPRIIIMLRDPVDRAYSVYKSLVRDGRERLSFADGLAMEAQRKQEGYANAWRYREVGLYSHQVRAYLDNFSRVQVFLYDDLKKDAASFLRSLYSFLEVDSNFQPDMSRRYNVSGVPRWSLLSALLARPQRLHKAVRSIGISLMGEDGWGRLRDRIRSPLLQKPQGIDPQVERQLRQFFREDIVKLQGYIGRDLSAWLEGKAK